MEQVNWDRLRKVRVERTRKVITEKGLGAVILTAFDNVRYLTDVRPLFTPSVYVDGYAAILTKDGEVTLVAPFVEEKPLGYAEVMPPIYIPSPIVSDRWIKIFKDILTNEGITKGKVGVDYFPLSVYRSAKKELLNVKFVPILEDLLKVRAVKHEEEIKLLREAASIVDLGAKVGLGAIKEGRTEYQILAEIIHVMVEAGIEAIPWYPTFRSGERSLKSIFASDRKVREGDPVIFDIGCVARGGYWADLTRTGFVGEPSEDLKETYRALYEVYIETIKSIKPGIMASELDKTCKRKLKEAGYPVGTAPTGHGLGLGVDLPWIWEDAKEKDMKLEPGMVLSLEPITFKPGLAAVKLEDMILVTDTGYELLTKAKYEEQYL